MIRIGEYWVDTLVGAEDVYDPRHKADCIKQGEVKIPYTISGDFCYFDIPKFIFDSHAIAPTRARGYMRVDTLEVYYLEERKNSKFLPS